MRARHLTVVILCSLPLFGCPQPDVGELEADSKEMRAEIRELREDVRSLRADTRELREKIELGEQTKPPPVVQSPAEKPRAKVDEPPPGPPPKQSNVKIQVNSNPRGATVFLGEKILGKTPLLFEHPPGNEQLMLRIDRPGYQARLMSLRPDEDAKISVQLRRSQ